MDKILRTRLKTLYSSSGRSESRSVILDSDQESDSRFCGNDNVGSRQARTISFKKVSRTIILIGILFITYLGFPKLVFAREELTLPFADKAWPISQGYHSGHRAIDYDTPNDPSSPILVVAAASGKVEAWQDGWNNDPACHCYGNYVKVDHGDGLETIYAHLKKGTLTTDVESYRIIKRGSRLGYENNSGNSSGDHLHFEARLNGASVNPYSSSTYLWSANPPSLSPDILVLGDIATFYDYGDCETRIHTFLSNGGRFEYQGSSGWWLASGYCADKVKQAVSGDFNGDGNSDIATLYDYGGTSSRIHTFTSSGSKFLYSGSSGWWNSTNYNLGLVYKAVSGRFNSDNLADIALLYSDAAGHTQIHVFTSTGSGFSGPKIWWDSGGYTASRVVGLAAGRFDGDSLTDIAALYDYGNGASRIHVFTSISSAFSYEGSSGWWNTSSGYSAAKVKHFVAAKFNDDSFSDVAALYDYGDGQARIHTFLSNGSRFLYEGSSGWWLTPSGYNLDSVPFALSGYFDKGSLGDIAVIYDYSGSETRIHTFLSTGSKFSYSGSSGWWLVPSGYTTSSVKHAVSGQFDR